MKNFKQRACRAGQILHSGIFLVGLIAISNEAQQRFSAIPSGVLKWAVISISIWYLWRCFYRPFERASKSAGWTLPIDGRAAQEIPYHRYPMTRNQTNPGNN